MCEYMPHVYRCPWRPDEGIDAMVLAIQEAVSHQMMVIMVVVVAMVPAAAAP